MKRRHFLRSVATASAVASVGNLSWAAEKNRVRIGADSNRFKISLNAYSFNEPLRSNKTNLDTVLRFCADEGFDAADLTGYYFPGYPEVPPDEYIYRLKRNAHFMGVEISGTGIRTEFGDPDRNKRNTEIEFVKKWIDTAAKLGAPVLRVFTAKAMPAGYEWQQAANWMIEDLQNCAAYGKQKGVIVAMQNHNDFVKTADQAIQIVNKVNSEWFGLVLDTGSFVTSEPYSEIRKTANYAVNWQVKEKFTYNGTTELMDLEKLFTIVKASDYRGYLPIETLSPGDPFLIVPPFFRQVKAALNKVMAV